MFVLSRAMIGVMRAAVLEEQPFFKSRAFEDELVRLVLAYLGSITKEAAAPAAANVEQDAEFVGEVAAHARMHPALLVEEAAGRTHREDAFVPDAGMDVDAEAAVGPQRDEVFGLQVVARPGDGHDERLAVEREEELAAVGMVVAMPQQHAVASQGHAGRGLLGPLAEADDIVAADRFVAPQKLVAAPFAGEDALGRAALDAGAGIELAPAGKRPRHDLDAMVAGVGRSRRNP